MSQTTDLTDFGGGAEVELDGPEFPETCTDPDCEESNGTFASLCFEHQSHQHDPDGELVDREAGYDPEQPECGYCGRLARPSHDPRRCRQCGTLDASEVIR